MPPTPTRRGRPPAADVAWDLEPLVDGQGEAGVDAMLDERRELAAAS